MKSHWREQARDVIRKVLTENEGKSDKEIRKALREAYPFGERQYHPYKIWLDEVALQTGKKKVNHYRQRVKVVAVSDGQMELI